MRRYNKHFPILPWVKVPDFGCGVSWVTGEDMSIFVDVRDAFAFRLHVGSSVLLDLSGRSF